MRQPVGQEWNTLATARELTAPEWTTRAGLIIQPVKAGAKRGPPQGGAGDDAGADRPPGPALALLHRSAVAVAGKGRGKSRAR